MSLIIHGVPLSQPFRSVVWPCLIKGTSFSIKIATPGKATGKYNTRRPEYLSKFPFGTIPSIEDEFEGKKVYLSEAPAILAYLSSKHGWLDIYPTEITERAKVDEFMHWHHSNLRSLTKAYFRVFMMGPNPILTPDVINVYQRAARHSLKILEKTYLASSNNASGLFLLGTPHPTAADFMAYEEICQLQFCNLHSLEEYPNIQAWSNTMKSLPFHDQVHFALLELGDLTTDDPPIAERLGPATKAGLKAITAAAKSQQQQLQSKL